MALTRLSPLLEVSGGVELDESIVDVLRRIALEQESECAEEEEVVRVACSWDKGAQLDAHLASVRAEFAALAIETAIATLRRDYQWMSREDFSHKIHGCLHTQAVLGDLEHGFRAALQAYVPKDRSQWLASSIEGHTAVKRAGTSLLAVTGAKAVSYVKDGADRAASLTKDVHLRTVACVAGGASCVGAAAGGATGLLSGTVSGCTLGMVAALPTLGCSLPVGATVGATLGLCAGAAAGAIAGLASGTMVCQFVQTRQLEVDGTTPRALMDWPHIVRQASKDRESDYAQAKLVQVTVVSAAGGSIALSISGGTLGMIAGGAFGATCGIVPAVVTFGLSIPVMASLGSCVGMCAGTAAGGAAGALGGGAAGYIAFSRQQQGCHAKPRGHLETKVAGTTGSTI